MILREAEKLASTKPGSANSEIEERERLALLPVRYLVDEIETGS